VIWDLLWLLPKIHFVGVLPFVFCKELIGWLDNRWRARVPQRGWPVRELLALFI
jgi:hypothetical protein